jgi:diguanylate cyclase (GGDEF)-like protein
MSVTVLVVDDSEALRRQMRDALEKAQGLDARVVEATDGAEALPIALGGGVDVVVSEVIMPNLDGVGLLRGIRQHRDPDDLPVILLTTDVEGASPAEAFEVGVNDYLTRPFSPLELITRVRVQLRLKQLQRELRRASETRKKKGNVDDLTGVANRRGFLEACRRELSRSRRHRLSTSVCMIDIDDLHRVNTEAGHRAGDALLRDLADLIGRQLRMSDLLARFAGGKFAVVFPHTNAGQAHTVCRRIRDAIREHAFPALRQGSVTVSAGQATYPGGAIESVEELVNAVEACLDRAKADGGDRIVTCTDGNDSPAGG